MWGLYGGLAGHGIYVGLRWGNVDWGGGGSVLLCGRVHGGGGGGGVVMECHSGGGVSRGVEMDGSSGRFFLFGLRWGFRG